MGKLEERKMEGTMLWFGDFLDSTELLLLVCEDG